MPSGPAASLLISSFDRYSDCWLPVCHGLVKYWPDCPFPIYLISNAKEFEFPGIQLLRVGQDTGWSGGMLSALARLATPYILYLQEDYWILEPVDTSRILSYVRLMDQEGLNYIRLLSKPQPDDDFRGDPRLGILAESAPYRTSVQVSLWRRDTLLELLVPGESAWQFEINGTLRSRRYGPTFLSTKRVGADDYHHGIRYLCSAVNTGKWSRSARWYVEREGLSVDFDHLPTETWWDELRRQEPVGRALAVLVHRLNLAFRHPGVAWQKLRRRLTARGRA